MKLALSRPVMLGGEKISELELREPTCRDIRKLKIGDAASVGELLDIVAGLAGVPPDVFDNLPPSDGLAAVALITPFFVRSPTTGPTS